MNTSLAPSILRMTWLALWVAIAIVVAAAVNAAAADRAKTEWVYPGPDGRLVYKKSSAGDRIMDYSHAGYMGGGVALPTVPVKRTVRPSDGQDDSAAIQTAINEVAAMSLENGFRGAILLAPGIFTCSNTITLSAGGVVLRGSGSGGADRTTIKLAGKPHTAITIRAPGGGRGQQSGGEPSVGVPPLSPTGGEGQGEGAAGSPRPSDGRRVRGEGNNEGSHPEFKSASTIIADAYVPSGAMEFTVADAAGFAVGDTIEIRRPVTEAWIKFMQMHDLVRDGRPQTWIRAGNTTTTERRVAAISGKTMTLDVPVSDSFDFKFLNPPGTAVDKIRPPQRISQAGIEHLHIQSPPQPISHTQPHFTAMRINGEDCWVRDVVCDETMNSIGIGGRRITLERVAVNRKALHQGSSKPAEFAPNAGQVLLDRCSVTGDNVWYAATGGGQAGPIVLLNCTFTGNGRAESHQRWSTGMLYDNCRAPGGGIDFRNRGSMGSGHGWSMGWGVAWNCVAKDYVIQNPPGAINWMIGCTGEQRPMPRPFGAGPNLPLGTMDSHGTPVTPQSLYLKQLAERLGPQAVRNIGY